ncbi:MAG: hypothetical protein GY697_17285 [Desulfobacterales bacterium]|nr:hypothetical protein [Desulfobacterales bacterium]
MAHIKTRRSSLMSTVAVIVVLGLILSLPAVASAAKPKIVAVQGVSYNVNAPIVTNLKALNGKRVYVTLNSGKVFTGLVKEVGEHLVHIEKLVGKEYFDALIRIEDIGAIDTMFRKLQR